MKTIRLNGQTRFQVYHSSDGRNMVLWLKGNAIPNLATCSRYKARKLAEAILAELAK